MSVYKQRRSNLAQNISHNSVVIIHAGSEKTLSHDTEYPFSVNRDFFYLTGYQEPEAVLVLSKDAAGSLLETLFVQDKDRTKEIWTGLRIGPEQAKIDVDVDFAYPLSALVDLMPNLLENKQIIYTHFYQDNAFFKRVQGWMEDGKHITPSIFPQSIQRVGPIIKQLRSVKDEIEIAHIKKMCAISANGHKVLMQSVKPGMTELELEALFLQHCQKNGLKSLSYGTIAACGNNGTILHYTRNDGELRDGDMVLVDAGVEGGKIGPYTSDITRTYPVNGAFTERQKVLYQIVLDAQLAAIDMLKPGVSLAEIEQKVIMSMTRSCIELGIFAGDMCDHLKFPGGIHAMDTLKSFALYPHSFGHWMGLNVHDPMQYRDSSGKSATLKPGMIITVEPGLYISKDFFERYTSDDLKASKVTLNPEFLGMAVRIEDDVLITENGCEVLTSAAPKTIEEIEAVMAASKNYLIQDSQNKQDKNVGMDEEDYDVVPSLGYERVLKFRP